MLGAAERDIRLLAPAAIVKTLSLVDPCAELHRRSDRAWSFLIVFFMRSVRSELRARLTDITLAAFPSR